MSVDTLFMYHDMIHSVRDCKYERQARGDAVGARYGRGFPSDLVKRTRAMLSAMDAAVVLEDLRFPPGNHLGALKGDRAGQPSIRINDQWRFCFVWTEPGPGDVEIVEHH